MSRIGYNYKDALLEVKGKIGIIKVINPRASPTAFLPKIAPESSLYILPNNVLIMSCPISSTVLHPSTRSAAIWWRISPRPCAS